MRVLTYSAIVGATFIFLAVVSALLWNYIYNSWANSILEQTLILSSYPQILLTNLSELVFHLRNISNISIDLDTYGLPYVTFYPGVTSSIAAKVSDLGLDALRIYRSDDEIWITVGRYQNWSLRTQLVQLEANNAYRLYSLYLGKFPRLPSNLWNESLEQVNFSIDRVKKLKQWSLGFLGDRLLKKLNDEYLASYNGDNRYFYIYSNPEICDQIKVLSGLVVEGSGFKSRGEVVVIKFNFTRYTNLSRYLNDPKKCKKFLSDEFRKFLVNFSYSFNYNNYSIILFPRKAIVNWTLAKEQTDSVLCTIDGHLVAYPSWLPRKLAEEICKDVDKVGMQRIESSQQYQHLLNLPSNFRCSSSGGASRVADCVRVCSNAIAAAISSVLQSFYSFLSGLFGGSGGPVAELNSCLSSCASKAGGIACGACCRGSDLSAAERYYSSCASTCIDKFKQSIVTVPVKEEIYSPGVNITFEVVSTELLVNQYPVNLSNWRLMNFSIHKSYLL